MKNHIITGLVAALVAGVVVWVARPYLVSDRRGGAALPEAAEDERRVLYWYDPMRPEVHFGKPGKSPFMDMQLVPKYADEGAGTGVVTVDPRMVQNLGVRTAVVARGGLSREVRAAGAVTVDEHRIAVVHSRAAGWVERLHVRAINDPVHRGQLLAEVYAPELFAAQQEFVLVVRAGEQDLMEAGRERLALLGVSPRQIAQLEESRTANRRVAIHAPINGVVMELGAREGQRIDVGQVLFRLVDLSTVWINAEIPEAEARDIRPGDSASATVPSVPGESFQGRVDYVYPEVTAETRTLRARVVLENPALELKPEMFARVVLSVGPGREALLVPTEALIRTGRRTVVIVVEGEGRFRPVAVTTGVEAGKQTEILAGLAEGQQIVTSGQFLIDSEANLRVSLDRLGDGDSNGDRLKSVPGPGAGPAAETMP